MPEKTVFDQYKEMVEKTKQLHSELVELSSKVDGMVGTMDASMYDSIKPAKRILPSASDVNVSSDLDNYSVRGSMKRQGSDLKKH
ncbi:hypothetical protein [Methanococcoides methylutens]|uniref:Uncharacterized protein n=1 Tax=Methanococcoides methylutens MM1 TaxID=1434104 RepID=A0A0E3WZC8_METMT|nr:hypothetical protein [Methanococcoides methylutens]AKB84635.1 hypothetical protein MCMEM_0582 [Methanococcoides methylutens MM1]